MIGLNVFPLIEITWFLTDAGVTLTGLLRKIGLYTFGKTANGMYVWPAILSVFTFPDLVGLSGFLISRDSGALLTGTKNLPSIFIGFTFPFIIGV